jgi:hypothetical protein
MAFCLLLLGVKRIRSSSVNLLATFRLLLSTEAGGVKNSLALRYSRKA